MRTRHRASDGTYGVPRITAELRETGEVVNHKRVARIMQTIGPAGLRLRRRHRTTVPDPAAAKAPDLIGCDLSTGPNQLWAADMSYVRTWTHLDAPGRTLDAPGDGTVAAPDQAGFRPHSSQRPQGAIPIHSVYRRLALTAQG
ncbi:IS3 family transposase [Streptomyces halstedii]|uniref:IS3 family transposase n=1 Tax=Streptomyces halstedii TaxID=1944 RepID=UPI00378EF5C9